MKRRYGLDLINYKKKVKIFRIVFVFILFSIIIASSVFFYRFFNSLNRDSVSTLYRYWNMHTAEGFSKVYEVSGRILDKNPQNNTALTFRGYSSFILAESELDNSKSMALLDEAIFNLRTSMQNCKKSVLPQVHYMLGRSYFYKNKISAYHYYSDLVVKYLNEAVDSGYKSDDIPLLLGLSYASLGETDNSIAAFTEALLVRETDTLLFNIAKQYYNNKQGNVAKQYLHRVIDTTSDEDLILNSHALLGQIYTDEDNLQQAEESFNTILNVTDNYADAHYGLGLIYERQGDSVKARAEYRKCLKIQFNHPGALNKISEIR